MTKTSLQSNLENFVCMLTQDYDFLDQDLPIRTIQRLLILVNEDFFKEVIVLNWKDIQSHLQQFYIQNNIELNAMEDFDIQSIEEGKPKALLESLIILCSFVSILNKDCFDDVKEYFINNVPMNANDNFFPFIDEYSEELKRAIPNQSNSTNQMIPNNQDTQELLNMISKKNNIIQDLEQQKNTISSKMDQYKLKIEELNQSIEEHESKQKEAKRNLIKQEKIFENKYTALEEELQKQKDEHAAKIKKMITNQDLEISKIKHKFQNFEEEKITLQKEILKLENEKKISEKTLKVKNVEIQKLKKKNDELIIQIDDLEVKYKTNENKKTKISDFMKKNKELIKKIEELEKKIKSLEKAPGNGVVSDIVHERSSSNRIPLELLNEISPLPTPTDDINESPHDDYKFSHIGLRESEVELGNKIGIVDKYLIDNPDVLLDRNSLGENCLDSNVKTVNMNRFKFDDNQTNINESKNKELLDKEDAGILYSVMSEYIINHLDMKNYYLSRKTRERDIMRPFIIDEFFK